MCPCGTYVCCYICIYIYTLLGPPLHKINSYLALVLPQIYLILIESLNWQCKNFNAIKNPGKCIDRESNPELGQTRGKSVTCMGRPNVTATPSMPICMDWKGQVYLKLLQLLLTRKRAKMRGKYEFFFRKLYTYRRGKYYSLLVLRLDINHFGIPPIHVSKRIPLSNFCSGQELHLPFIVLDGWVEGIDPRLSDV